MVQNIEITIASRAHLAYVPEIEEALLLSEAPST